jgi:hypothetical protein
MRARMATNQEMMTTENMTLAEQMELGSVTMCCWPTPIEQLTREGVMELGLSTMNSWQEIEPSVGQIKYQMMMRLTGIKLKTFYHQEVEK